MPCKSRVGDRNKRLVPAFVSAFVPADQKNRGALRIESKQDPPRIASNLDGLIEAIRQDKLPRLNIQEDVKTYEIAFAAELSAREGRPVKLPLPR